MEAYGKFARVYDLFMDNIDYEEWADYIQKHLEEQGIRDGLVLELGCGTGTMTELLAASGYDMIGVDNSEEMLAEAMHCKGYRVEKAEDLIPTLEEAFRQDVPSVIVVPVDYSENMKLSEHLKEVYTKKQEAII